MNDSDLRVILDRNPIVCDCKDYDIILYVRSSVSSTASTNWLRGINCAAPPELANEKVGIPSGNNVSCIHLPNPFR